MQINFFIKCTVLSVFLFCLIYLYLTVTLSSFDLPFFLQDYTDTNGDESLTEENRWVTLLLTATQTLCTFMKSYTTQR